MTTNSTQISPTAYDPDETLRNQLKEVFEKAQISYGATTERRIGGYTFRHRDYTVILGEFELSGYETLSPLGVFSSLEGHVGLAASVVLVHATVWGEITQVYLDDAPPPDQYGERYQDLTAEWYREVAIEAGVPERRMETRISQFKADMIDIDQLEEYAQFWLSKGE